MPGFQELIDFILNGEPVNSAVANRASRAIDGNTRYLRDVLEASIKGESVIAFCKSVKSDVKEGQAVYFNSSTLQYEGGIAQTEIDVLTGTLVTAGSAQIWGIVLNKVNATKADILLGGIGEVTLADAVIGAIELGKVYYLSGTSPGMMSSSRPPVGVPVMMVGQQTVDPLKYEVLVNPNFTDFLEDHSHVKFDLQAVPAGTHAPPAIGSPHVITSPDVNTEGWLPSTHASFNGLAPAGARFGYNLAASKLAQVWPPVPVASSILEMCRQSIFANVKALQNTIVHDFPLIASHGFVEQTFSMVGAVVGDAVNATSNIALPDDTLLSGWVDADDSVTLRMTNSSPGAVNPAITSFNVLVFKGPANSIGTQVPSLSRLPEDVVVINTEGIWWMTDCYNEVPWPTNLDTDNPTSTSSSLSCPLADQVADVLLSLWYTHTKFYTSSTAVLSVKGKAGSGVSVFCRNTDDLKETGHLEIDFDLSVLVNGGAQTGHLVFKTFDPTSKTFNTGPVAESIRTTSPEITLTSDVAAIGENGERYGNIIINANLDLNGAEFPVETVRLDGVEEEFYKDVIGLGFPNTRASEFRGRVKIPTRITLPSGTTMKFRFWVQGRIAGSLGAAIFPLSYRRLLRPSAVLTALVALPTSDTALTMLTTATFANPDEYIEMESAAFVVTTGDEILFTMSRAASDGYGDKLILLRQEGVIILP